MVRVEQPATQTMPVNARTKRVGFIGKSPLGSNALPVEWRARPRPGRARSRKGVGARFEAAQVVRDERLVSAGLTKVCRSSRPVTWLRISMVSGAWVRLAQPPTGGHCRIDAARYIKFE